MKKQKAGSFQRWLDSLAEAQDWRCAACGHQLDHDILPCAVKDPARPVVGLCRVCFGEIPYRWLEP